MSYHSEVPPQQWAGILHPEMPVDSSALQKAKDTEETVRAAMVAAGDADHIEACDEHWYCGTMQHQLL